jgi:D-serine deaminase-like pyridoxal phosphate-dependent protein
VPDLPDLATPCAVVDRDVLDRNVATMAARTRDRAMALRPHAKTHKCWEIARRQLAAGASGLTVATVSEAEIFVGAGCTDLFIAYPLWADPRRSERLRDLAQRCSLRVGVDSAEGAVALARNTGGAFEVLVEVDSGHHRTGVPPEAAGAVALAAARAGLTVRGVFTFPGHSYGPGLPGPAVLDEAQALHGAASSVQRVGLPVDVLSGGSSPTASLTTGSPVTELRPGVYVFNDAQQVELGSCGVGDVAFNVIATVVSRAPDRLVLDAGSKVLGADRPPWTTGYGRLPDHPEARITALSEHHATVSWAEAENRPELGATVRVMPNHVCTAVNLADELVVLSGGSVVDRWPVLARGANT